MMVGAMLGVVAGQSAFGAGTPDSLHPTYAVLKSQSKLPATIKPGDSVDFKIDIADDGVPKTRSIRVDGYVAGRSNRFHHDVQQLRECVETNGAGESVLRITWNKGDAFPRQAFAAIDLGKRAPGSGKAEVEVGFKADKLNPTAGRDCGVKLEFYRSVSEIADADPVKTLFLPFEAGSYGWTKRRATVEIPREAAAVLFTVGGLANSGTVRATLPKLTLDGKNVELKPFREDVARPGVSDWLGMSISRLEWPKFKFYMDGKLFNESEAFMRMAHKACDFERELPPLKAGEHTLKVELASDWPKAVGYTLREVGLIEESARDFEMVGFPEFVAEKSIFHVAVENNRPNVELRVAVENAKSMGGSEVVLKKPGLHALDFMAGKPGLPAKVTISAGGRSAEAKIKLVTIGKSDGIIIGTSDWVYVTKEVTDEYFKWLLANDMVNCLTIRPSYNWAGTRTREKPYYEKVKKFLCDFSLPYALMVEGRNLAGAQFNPPDEWLAGKYYLGRQSHEDDGSYYYWGGGNPYRNPLNRILMGRFLDPGGIFNKFTFNSHYAKTMKDGAEHFIANLKRAKGASTRHTGPSVLFRYFYQAGYDWLGAEQCYGPEAVLMAALRGASRAYGKTRYGTHHATQWGYRWGNPETQFKSHAVAYLNGATHINTEDALWTTEGDTHRFTDTMKRHIERQKDMLDFIRTHNRQGRQATPVAVLQGEYDGWVCFRYHSVWAQSGGQWKDGDAERSSDLLKVFYPRKRLQGFSIGPTPYGQIDFLPVEAPRNVLANYDSLIFLGWNSYIAEDFKRIAEYVRNGGTLMLTKAHLNTNLFRMKPITLPQGDAFVDEILAKGAKAGKSPAALKIGKGRVIFFNTGKYPANAEIRDLYEAEMRKLADESVAHQRRKGWITNSDQVQFAAWDADDRMMVDRTIFMFNVGGGTAQAKLLLDKAEHGIGVPEKVIAAIYVSDGVAAYPSDPLTSVLKIGKSGSEIKLVVQAVNPGAITVYKDIPGSKPVTVKVPGAGIRILTVK